MSIFLRSSMCFRVPHLYSKIPKINNWSMIIVVYKVCASVVISPLRQWLDSYAKTRLKMWHTFKHFIHVQYFLLPTNLLSSLYIELALVCCMNPDNVHCFGTIFPNLNFVFASICAARPVHIQSDQYRSCSTVNNVTTRDRCSTQPKTALWLWAREITWYLSTRGVRGQMKAKQRGFKVTRELCHEWFHHFRHHVHDSHWTGEFATVIWRLHCFTVSFRGDVRGESGPR